jgi:hypothetical protein
MTDPMLALTLDLRATKPWHFAEPDSIWEITGTYPNGRDTFTSCLARVLPSTVTGTDAPLFELLVYGERSTVCASDITAARELLLVHASEPLTTYYVRDQPILDEALNGRDETR